MKIHEYQAKALLKKFGVPVQDGIAIKNLEEYDIAINELISRGINQYVVKSQIHAGGRGKGKVHNKNNRDELVVEGGVGGRGSDLYRRQSGDGCLVLVTRHQIAGGQDHLKDVIFRIGHMGCVSAPELLATLAATEYAIQKAGHKPASSGVMAAAEVLG